MSNSTFEQFGYKSPRDLMADLVHDITDGGDLVAVKEPYGTRVKSRAYKFEGGYWLITYRRGRLVSIDYFDALYELLFVMGV